MNTPPAVGRASITDRALSWTWGQVTFVRNRRLVIVLLLYIAAILTFATVYEWLYRSSVKTQPNRHFVFDTGINRARSRQVRDDAQRDLDIVEKQLGIVTNLQKSLSTLTSAPKPAPGYDDYAEFTISDYSCEFQLIPVPSLSKDNHWVKHIGLMIKDPKGATLLNRVIQIVGPKDIEPRPPDLQAWFDAVSSRDNIDLYRQASATVLMGLASEKDRLVQFVETISDDTERFWSYWDFVYFSTITQTTVGYGDILPNSTQVRMLVVAQVLIGLVLVGFALNFAFRRSRQN
jgi:hypothetical protein